MNKEKSTVAGYPAEGVFDLACEIKQLQEDSYKVARKINLISSALDEWLLDTLYDLFADKSRNSDFRKDLLFYFQENEEDYDDCYLEENQTNM